MAAFWLPVRAFTFLSFWWFCLGYLVLGLALFLRPVQKVVLTRMLGARTPSPHERTIIDPVWAAVTQAVRSSPKRYVLAVVDADEVNAYACGGHLVVVTSFAIRVLPERELGGVLVHELSHHLGLHTVALTLRHWLSLPVLLLASVGFYLQHVAEAATAAFAHRSRGLTAVGLFVSTLLRAVAWAFQLGIIVSNSLANLVGKGAEFEADRRAVDLGFGPALSAALRRFVASGFGAHPTTWRDKAFASHPPARTRIARIEALLRSNHPSGSH